MLLTTSPPRVTHSVTRILAVYVQVDFPLDEQQIVLNEGRCV